MKNERPHIFVLIFLTGLLNSFCGLSQCLIPTSTTSYQEDFELNNGGWFTGGNYSDWTWGTPTKAVIKTAASGSRCWIVGKLSGNSYANGEASWLQSPCFDFSSLSYPHISFSVFWETERRFDGANLQYSLDNGNSWTNVGSTADQNDCLNTNWYNFASITYLAPLSAVSQGWSGNVQNTAGSCQGGNGSGTWVTAQKILPQLAGASNVVFRFTFGAGTVCNNFDGFAIDKVVIGEAPRNEANYSYNCLPARQVNFTSTSGLCPTSFQWDFGDPASGTANTSTSQNPTHTFAYPGAHQVSLTVSGTGNAPSTTTKTVIVLDLTASIMTPINCSGDNNGALTAITTGTVRPLTYTWNTNPQQIAPIATNLSAGTYSVTVTAEGVCPATADIQLIQPNALSHTSSVTQPGCNSTTGSATITENGGTKPYTYTWSPAVSTGPSANNLLPGQYTITVKDSLLCSEIIDINIVEPIKPVVSITGKKNVSCKGGADGTATALITAANAPVTYSWNTIPAQQTAIATGLSAGIYIVTMTDNNRCTAFDTITISEPMTNTTAEKTISNTVCGLQNGNIRLTTQGGNGPYQYSWQPNVSTTASSGNIISGTYQVKITDANGCVVDLNDIVVANRGTPARPNLGNDTTICKENPYLISPGSFTDYTWQDSSKTPVFRISETGLYKVKVTNTEGCAGTDSVRVTVRTDCGDVFFPGSFSPNGDSKNDLFGVLGNIDLLSNYRLNIFNRYGSLVFTTTQPLTKWNGVVNSAKPLIGTYVWFATYTLRGIIQRSQYGTVVIIK